MENVSVLIAQPDSVHASRLSRVFSSAGYDCEYASDGPSTLRKALTKDFAVVILDEALPLQDGMAVCADIRSKLPGTAVVFVTATAETNSRLRAFRSGADDYIALPYNSEELLLRIAAVLRRTLQHAGSPCRIGRALIDLSNGKAFRDSMPVALTPKALELLRYLHAHRGHMISKRTILREVWHYATHNTRTIDVHVAMLRQLIETNPKHPQHLITFRSKGYLLSEQPIDPVIKGARATSPLD